MTPSPRAHAAETGLGVIKAHAAPPPAAKAARAVDPAGPKAQEAKALKKAAKKEIKINANGEEDDEEDEDEDEEDEEDEEEDEDENDDQMADKSGSGQESEQEELKMQADGAPEEEDETKLGFVDESDEEDDLDEAFDLNVTMDMLRAPLKKADEFAIFNGQLRNLHTRDPGYVNNLLSQLDQGEKDFLKQLMETKRIKIEHKGVETEVARRIITVKRRKPQ
jgi:hypothetical protein